MEREIAPPPPLIPPPIQLEEFGTLAGENCHVEGSAFQCVMSNHGNDF